MKAYFDVDWQQGGESVITELCTANQLVPVAVEVLDSSEGLDSFEHPDKALYAFGPEDGDLPKGVRAVCHRFVRIPTLTRTPLNLAAAVNIVLYDRYVKGSRRL